MKRFRILSCQLVDGYWTAQVEWFVDEPLETEEDEAAVIQLHDRVRDDAIRFTLAPSRIDKLYECLPEVETDWKTLADGPCWLWWLMSILSIDPKTQVGIKLSNTK